MATVEETAQRITQRINEKYNGDIDAYLDTIEYSEHLRKLDAAIEKFRANMRFVGDVTTDALNEFIDAYQRGITDSIPGVNLFTGADEARIVSFVRNAS